MNSFIRKDSKDRHSRHAVVAHDPALINHGLCQRGLNERVASNEIVDDVLVGETRWSTVVLYLRAARKVVAL